MTYQWLIIWRISRKMRSCPLCRHNPQISSVGYSTKCVYYWACILKWTKNTLQNSSRMNESCIGSSAISAISFHKFHENCDFNNLKNMKMQSYPVSESIWTISYAICLLCLKAWWMSRVVNVLTVIFVRILDVSDKNSLSSREMMLTGLSF